MGDRQAPSADDIVELIGFSTEFLPHPVALLTVEQAAARAGVPKSTVDSAVEGSSQFREMVVAHVIESLHTEPGRATWDALGVGLRSGCPVEAIAGLLVARASELAVDPGLPLYLGGYDCLEKPRVAGAVDQVARAIVDRFTPFVETVVATLGDSGAVVAQPDQAFVILHVLLTEAYRRLPGFPRAEPDVEMLVARQSAALVLDEFSSRIAATAGSTSSTFVADASDAIEGPSGRLGAAVRAGADIVRQGAIPLSMSVTVNDVTSATGMSVASFYRRFGSIAELERALLACVSRDIVTCFKDAFFDELLDRAQSGELGTGAALALFAERASVKVAEHVEVGRPDRQTIPWMQIAVVADVFREAYREGYILRGRFYEQFSELVGVSLAPGLTGAVVSSVLNSHSIISELLIRNAPDRAMAAVVMHTRFPRINRRLFL